MCTGSKLIHPSSFTSGTEYLWQKQRDSQGNVLVPVQFVKYDPCPAFIIVRSQVGKRWRCPRDDVLVRV